MSASLEKQEERAQETPGRHNKQEKHSRLLDPWQTLLNISHREDWAPFFAPY